MSLLDDPSFEQTQPSWVRRSRSKNSSTSTSAKSGLPHSGTEGVDNPYDNVDHPTMKGVKENMEDIKMEFEDEGRRALLTMVAITGTSAHFFHELCSIYFRLKTSWFYAI